MNNGSRSASSSSASTSSSDSSSVKASGNFTNTVHITTNESDDYPEYSNANPTYEVIEKGVVDTQTLPQQQQQQHQQQFQQAQALGSVSTVGGLQSFVPMRAAALSLGATATNTAVPQYQAYSSGTERVVTTMQESTPMTITMSTQDGGNAAYVYGSAGEVRQGQQQHQQQTQYGTATSMQTQYQTQSLKAAGEQRVVSNRESAGQERVYYCNERVVTGQPRVISETSRVVEGEQRILSQKVIEHEVRVPRKVVRETVVERTMVVPETTRREEVVDEVQMVREKVVTVQKPTVQEKIVEVPEYVYVDRAVEVPEVRVIENVKTVPKVMYEERIVEVPKIVYEERVVEVPGPTTHREVVTERVVEVPEIREEVIVKEVPIPQYVEKQVPKYVDVEVPQYVDRTLPVPVEAITVFEYRAPKVTPRRRKVPFPLYIPRFIEVAVPEQALQSFAASQRQQIEAFITHLSAPQPVSLCDIENFAREVKAHDHSRYVGQDFTEALVSHYQQNSGGYTTLPQVTGRQVVPTSTTFSSTLTPGGSTGVSYLNFQGGKLQPGVATSTLGNLPTAGSSLLTGNQTYVPQYTLAVPDAARKQKSKSSHRHHSHHHKSHRSQKSHNQA